jgi:hypothetical protein
MIATPATSQNWKKEKKKEEKRKKFKNVFTCFYLQTENELLAQLVFTASKAKRVKKNDNLPQVLQMWPLAMLKVYWQ